ncbi:hypothetical protein LP417_35655 (plasmid) [Polaromonas sp. P1-6]|nr:hypothetical protein LP417_35655 [Polaromonas sp. P1-6]
MKKKLVAFGSESGQHFYALVNAYTEDEHVRNLAKAAISDTNREGATNLAKGLAGCDDGLPVMASIKARLEPLGFEFVEDTTVGPWESLKSDLTLTEARLNASRVTFRRDEVSKELVIPTETGDIVIDARQKVWRCTTQDTHGVIRRSGFEALLQLIVTLPLESVSHSRVHELACLG